MTSYFQDGGHNVISHRNVLCRHLVSAHAESAWRIYSSVRQFLIHSTFVFLFITSAYKNINNLAWYYVNS